MGDRKLLSTTNRVALLAAEVGYTAPLPRTPDLDAACLAIPPEALTRLDYVSARDRTTPPKARTTYHGYDTTTMLSVPDDHGEEPVLVTLGDRTLD